MTDKLLETLLDIATPALNAECLFSAFPRNRLLEPALCPSCCDVYVERGEQCDACKAAHS
jgi:hypothetical protein